MTNSVLWLGILPILAFVVLDTFFEKRKALFFALILGIGELAFSLFHFGSLDSLSWVTFGLVCLSLSISLKTNNDVFFKIQGPLVNILLSLAILLGDWIFNINLLLQAFEKYIGFSKTAEWLPHVDSHIFKNFLIKINMYLPWGLLIHSSLTFWSALKWNRWIWLALRVPGLFLMLYTTAWLASK
jgi:intracellular septation protein